MTAGSIFGYSMDGVCELVKQTPGAFAASREIAERHLARAHELGLDAHAGTLHTVRGRARVAQGDGDGLEEMVMGVELAERHDRPMLAVVARTYLAAALHHWRGPAAEKKSLPPKPGREARDAAPVARPIAGPPP